MRVYDTIKKEEITTDIDGLVKIMIDGRQVDLIFEEAKTDADGYIKWDIEHWSSLSPKKFIRTYTYNGKYLSESTGHNIYDLKNEFHPEDAKAVELS